MSKKNLVSTVALLLVFSVIMAGCLPAPGSKARPARVSGSNIKTTDEKSRSYMNLASALVLEGEYTMALVELEKAKAIDPRNVDLQNLLGLSYYGLKEYDLAMESYLKALEMNSSRTDVRNNLGLTYLAQKHYDQALVEFTTASKDLAYEKKHLPLSNIGLTYMEMGRYDDALAALNKVTEVAPNFANAYQLIGKVYLAQGKYRDALDYLNNAARLQSNDPETYMALGEALAGLGRLQEGAEAYGRVTTLVPRTPLALEAQKKARYLMGFE